jgi:hypothetical protein
MRALRITTSIFAAVLLLAAATSKAGAKPPTTSPSGPTVHLTWQRLAGGVAGVYDDGGGNYLALTAPQGASDYLSLLNKQTGVRTPLSPPDCPSGEKRVGFGGPWFAVSCILPDLSEQVDLYDLATSTWTEVPLGLAAACGEDQLEHCAVAAVGTTWIRFFDSPDAGGCAHICDYIGYLQSIATGAVELDPANDASAHTLDDLDSPSGIAPHTCPSPPSSAYSSSSGNPGGGWQQLGRFALAPAYNYAMGLSTTYLYRCHSKMRLRLSGTWFGSFKVIVSPPTFGPDSRFIRGRWLPSLKPFLVKPKGLLSAVSNRTLYTIRGSSLWAGTLPGR